MRTAYINKTFAMEIGEHDSLIYSKTNLRTCENCHRHFPTDKLDLHEAYCSRNFRKCTICGLMVDKAQLADHEVNPCLCVARSAHHARLRVLWLDLHGWGTVTAPFRVYSQTRALPLLWQQLS